MQWTLIELLEDLDFADNLVLLSQIIAHIKEKPREQRQLLPTWVSASMPPRPRKCELKQPVNQNQLNAMDRH